MNDDDDFVVIGVHKDLGAFLERIGEPQLLRDCDTCGEPVMLSGRNEKLYEEKSAVFRHLECCEPEATENPIKAIVDGEITDLGEGLARVAAGLRRN